MQRTLSGRAGSSEAGGSRVWAWRTKEAQDDGRRRDLLLCFPHVVSFSACTVAQTQAALIPDIGHLEGRSGQRWSGGGADFNHMVQLPFKHFSLRSKARPESTEAVASLTLTLIFHPELPDKLRLRCGCSLTKALPVCSPPAPQQRLSLISSLRWWNWCRPVISTLTRTNSTRSSSSSSSQASVIHHW